MNIVIIGGGQKFGRLIADKFINAGHNVYILSHKNYGDNPNHLHANFLDINDVRTKFQNLIKNISNIDLLLYNSNADYGPSCESHFTSKADLLFALNSWQSSMQISAYNPYLIAVTALDKMNAKSKIVFMTNHLSFAVPRNYCISSVGQPSGKAAQNHLMFALSHYNDRKAIVYSIFTHLDYDDIEKLNDKINKIYYNLCLFDNKMSGTIIDIS